MRWSDVTQRPNDQTLRQFGGLCLLCLWAVAGSRAWHGQTDWRVWTLAAAGALIGAAGWLKPAAIRLVYSAWMIAAFPIGWAVSQVMLLLVFYVVFTPVAFVLRRFGRDVLRRRRTPRPTYWMPRPVTRSVDEYLRQS